jgi:hypothetical protein
MPAPFSSFGDPELSPLADQLTARQEQYAMHCLAEKPSALIDGLPARHADIVLKSIGADEGTIWLAVDDSRTLLPVWNNGPDAARFVGSFKLPVTDGISGFVFTSGIAACEAEVCFNQRQHRELDQKLAVLTWAMLAVPIVFSGAVRGVVTAVRLIRLSELPDTKRLPQSHADFPPGYQPPHAFGLADLGAMEAAASSIGKLVEHRLTAWVLGTED